MLFTMKRVYLQLSIIIIKKTLITKRSRKLLFVIFNIRIISNINPFII